MSEKDKKKNEDTEKPDGEVVRSKLWLGRIHLVLLTALFSVVLWQGSVGGVIWAKRVWIFYSWFAFIMQIMMAFGCANEEIREKIYQTYRDGKHFPGWFDWIVYLYRIGLSVAFGWIWVGIMWTFVGLIDGVERSCSVKKTA